MANSPSIFNFESAALRVLRDEAGTPWFNAGDLCAVLGYSNARDAIANHVDEDDVAKRDAIDTIGRTQSVNHVNESGMYALIFGSTKPEAKKFKRWVTSEVLPTIRQTGRFEAAQDTPLLAMDVVINATNAYANTVTTMGKLVGTRQAHVMANHQAQAMGVDLHKTWKLDPTPEVPAYTLDLAIERLVTLASALSETHPRRHAYILANQTLMDETGMDVLATLPFGLDDLSDAPPAAMRNRGVERIARYLSRAHSLPVPKFSPNRPEVATLLTKGYVPRQVLLKVMHMSAVDFNMLVAQAKRAKVLTEHDGAEFGYAGTLYKAGGAA